MVVQSPLGERRRKVRIRGKELAELPCVASTNDHHEYGLVMPERPQPCHTKTTSDPLALSYQDDR